MCQKSMPESSATFSSMLSLEIVSSTSRWNILRRVMERVGEDGRRTLNRRKLKRGMAQGSREEGRG